MLIAETSSGEGERVLAIPQLGRARSRTPRSTQRRRRHCPALPWWCPGGNTDAVTTALAAAGSACTPAGGPARGSREGRARRRRVGPGGAGVKNPPHKSRPAAGAAPTPLISPTWRRAFGGCS
eukprot:gene17485-biopygen3816